MIKEQFWRILLSQMWRLNRKSLFRPRATDWDIGRIISIFRETIKTNNNTTVSISAQECKKFVLKFEYLVIIRSSL